jgi:tripeptide aminopeptidase
MTEPKYSTRCVERFLEYVKFDTQSEEGQECYPSTPKQLVLLKHLLAELKAIGLEDATMDEHGYVFATIPSNVDKEVPTIGFIAHVDTSPEMPGKDVKAIIHKNYQGQDIVLPDDEKAVLKAADNPAMAEQIGNDLITASGTTLLGADNKAGVAEIVSAADYMMSHPEIKHGPVRLGFTPDEEVGEGTKFFDVKKFGAFCAYTMDGETLGHLETETFSADSLIATFHGFNTHPGFAKGKMINAIKVAADFITRLPKTGLSPETTEGYEGFVHPYVIDAGVETTSIKFLIRDFKTELLKEKEELLTRLANETVADWPGVTVDVEVIEQYRNMGEILEKHPKIVDAAKKAIQAAGLNLSTSPIRGGTDGSRLSFMGLPTPNIFAGEHNFHSRLEWISAYDMNKAVEVIIELSRIWAK